MDILLDLYNALMAALEDLVYWFFNLIADLVAPLLDSVFTAFPDLVTGIDGMGVFLSYLTFFVPLSYGMGLLIAHWAIMVGYLVFKMPMRYIVPTVG